MVVEGTVAVPPPALIVTWPDVLITPLYVALPAPLMVIFVDMALGSVIASLTTVVPVPPMVKVWAVAVGVREMVDGLPDEPNVSVPPVVAVKELLIVRVLVNVIGPVNVKLAVGSVTVSFET